MTSAIWRGIGQISILVKFHWNLTTDKCKNCRHGEDNVKKSEKSMCRRLLRMVPNEKKCQLAMSDTSDSEYNTGRIREERARAQSKYKYLLSPLDCSALCTGGISWEHSTSWCYSGKSNRDAKAAAPGWCWWKLSKEQRETWSTRRSSTPVNWCQQLCLSGKVNYE